MFAHGGLRCAKHGLPLAWQVVSAWEPFQCRFARTFRRLPARRSQGRRQNAEGGANCAGKKLALVTLSGPTSVTGNDVWCGLADAMAEVGGNIEEAAGTFLQMTRSHEEAGAVSSDVSPAASPRFMVGAFDTIITPSSENSNFDGITVAIFVKASVPINSVPLLSHRMHTRFPQFVCTVTVGSGLDAGGPKQAHWSRMPTGTIYLFGYDQVGQLARITEVLLRCKVTILNLQVTTGHCDPETCEFLEGPGKRKTDIELAENVVTIAAFDEAAFDEESLRQEVLQVGRSIGYLVSTVILDNQSLRAQELAGYYLRRKDFLAQLHNTDHFGTRASSGMD